MHWQNQLKISVLVQVKILYRIRYKTMLYLSIQCPFNQLLSFWRQIRSVWWHVMPVAAPEIFLWGGIEGAKCNSEGVKIKNLPKMADFGHFFLDGGGKWGAEPPTGGKCPHAPLDAATAWHVTFDSKLHPFLWSHIFWQDFNLFTPNKHDPQEEEPRVEVHPLWLNKVESEYHYDF